MPLFLSSFSKLRTKLLHTSVHRQYCLSAIKQFTTIAMTSNDYPAPECCTLLSSHQSTAFKPEPNRYILYLQYGCPFAQRANILLHLKGLQSVIPLAVLDPTKTPSGFQFTGLLDTDRQDPVYGLKSIRELYWKTEPGRKTGFTVPVLWDKVQEKVVSNESGDIMRILGGCFEALVPDDRKEINRPSGGLYPFPLREEIDAMNEWIGREINTCVYQIANATEQKVYDDKIEILFKALDRAEGILGEKRFLMGETIAETDVRLFTSIVRFDAAYVGQLGCGRKMIRWDYPNIHRWLKELYWDDTDLTFGAFRKTTFFEHIQVLYSGWEPNRLILAGPKPDVLPL